jgi:hypothetical protein
MIQTQSRGRVNCDSLPSKAALPPGTVEGSKPHTAHLMGVGTNSGLNGRVPRAVAWNKACPTPTHNWKEDSLEPPRPMHVSPPPGARPTDYTARALPVECAGKRRVACKGRAKLNSLP